MALYSNWDDHVSYTDAELDAMEEDNDFTACEYCDKPVYANGEGDEGYDKFVWLRDKVVIHGRCRIGWDEAVEGTFSGARTP